jgi:hypothetical protein
MKPHHGDTEGTEMHTEKNKRRIKTGSLFFSVKTSVFLCVSVVNL